MVQPLAVDLRALRVLVGPDIKIVPGRAVMARVVQAPAGQRGSLSIAGYLLEAELPDNVRAGEDLRLVVREVSAERVLLAITDSHEAAQQQAQQAQQAQAPSAPIPLPDPSLSALPPVPLPGGGSVQVAERDAGGRGGGPSADRQNVLLRYDGPALGAVDLRFQMDGQTLHLGVTMAPGVPLELARAGADSLRQALAASLPERTVSVTVSPRRQPLDLYA
jgi:hypothetical protein